MAKRYRPVDRDQAFLFPPDMREWLPADHPVRLVITAVADHLDTVGVPCPAAGPAGRGRRGMTRTCWSTVLVWAYAHGITSSRRIEELCRTDVAFRVICAGNLPDHVDVRPVPGGFRRVRSAEFFAQVLMLVRAAGDGPAGDGGAGRDEDRRAARRRRRTGPEEGLRKLAAEAVAAHAAADAAEDALFGAGRRGDEVPEQAWSPRARAGRIRAALADLEAERRAAEQAEAAKAEEFRQRQRAGQRTGCSPASAAVELAQEKLARVMAAQQARIDDWQARNAASLAAAGKPLRHPPRRPAGEHCRVKEAAAKVEKARAREQAARAPGGGAGEEPQGPGPGAEHHRPGLAADAGPRRRVHPGLQRPERDQRRRADHRDRADR